MNKVSARKVAEFVSLTDFDKDGRVTIAVVPGHGAQWYQVSFDREHVQNDPCPTVRCRCMNPDLGEDCKGNKHGVCYHVVGALICAARKKDATLSMCESLTAAQNILTLGGKIVRILSTQSGKEVFAVYRKTAIDKKSKAE